MVLITISKNNKGIDVFKEILEISIFFSELTCKFIILFSIDTQKSHIFYRLLPISFIELQSLISR